MSTTITAVVADSNSLTQISSCDDVINNCDDVINNCDDVINDYVDVLQIFLPKNVLWLFRLLHIFKCTSDQFYHVSKHYEP